MISDQGYAASSVVEQIANLVAKSLVITDGWAPTGRWRLIETTRAYALELLAESGETEQVTRCCAEFYRDLVRPAMHGSQVPPAEDMARHGREIDNVRVAVLSNAAIDTDLRPQIALNAAFGNQTSPTLFVTEQEQIDAQNAATLAQYQLLRAIAPPEAHERADGAELVRRVVAPGAGAVHP